MSIYRPRVIYTVPVGQNPSGTVCIAIQMQTFSILI